MGICHDFSPLGFIISTAPVVEKPPKPGKTGVAWFFPCQAEKKLL
jgi:hypothetical protein